MGEAGIRRINFIEFNARINTLGSLGALFPKYGSLLLASLLRDKGYEVRYYLEGVSDMDFDAMTTADVLCLSVFAPAMNKVRAFAERVSREKPGTCVIMGGPQVCFFPEAVIDFCTYAVRCEGDEVLPALVDCLNSGGDVRRIGGISFRENGIIVHTPEGEPPDIPATIPDVSLIEGFRQATPQVAGRRAVINTLQTTRGCRFRCKFCPTMKLFQGSYRSRDIDSVVADIRKRMAYNDHFFVVDNDFCSDRKKTKALLNRLIEENIGARFIIFERHEVGRDSEMLDLLAKAGVRVIIVGVESLLDSSLKAFNKKQTKDDVLASIRNIKAHGMHVLSTFVLGYDDDTPETAREVVTFVTENRLSLNLFVLHDLEHDESKELLIPLNRRFMTHYERMDPADTAYWDYMTGSFVTYFPKKMKPSTLQRLIFEISDRAYSHRNILKHVLDRDLFQSFFGVSFGYRMKTINRNIRRFAERSYMEYLEKIEEGLYDEREQLIEEKLASLDGLPLPEPVRDYEDSTPYRVHVMLALIPAFARMALIRFRKDGIWPMGKESAELPSP